MEWQAARPAGCTWSSSGSSFHTGQVPATLAGLFHAAFVSGPDPRDTSGRDGGTIRKVDSDGDEGLTNGSDEYYEYVTPGNTVGRVQEAVPG